MLGFVVLHYQALDATENCVNSIQQFVKNPVIAIVDNCSPNGSGKLLLKKYRGATNIHCILSEENGGFAFGNNIGFKYLKDNYQCDFICCVNNDTLLIDNSFEPILLKAYERDKFAVGAPLVYLKDNSIQSFNPRFHTIEYYEQELEKYQGCETFHEYLRLLNRMTRFEYKFPLLYARLRKIKQKYSCPYKSSMKNVVLHGCFVIFSKEYISRFDTAFDQRTTMFREEELLYMRLKANNMRSAYIPELQIKHLEDVATNFEYKNVEAKYQFIRSNQLKSLSIIIEDLKRQPNIT